MWWPWEWRVNRRFSGRNDFFFFFFFFLRGIVLFSHRALLAVENVFAAHAALPFGCWRAREVLKSTRIRHAFFKKKCNLQIDTPIRFWQRAKRRHLNRTRSKREHEAVSCRRDRSGLARGGGGRLRRRPGRHLAFDVTPGGVLDFPVAADGVRCDQALQLPDTQHVPRGVA